MIKRLFLLVGLTFFLPYKSFAIEKSYDELTQYSITTASYPSNGGTATGTGVYDAGTTVTIRAHPNSNYYFIGWKENGVTVSTDSVYTFTILSDRTIIAYFEKWINITLSVSPVEGGTVSGAGKYKYGENVTVIAKANTGYGFFSWILNGFMYSDNSTLNFQAKSDMALEADFSVLTYNIYADVYNSIGGTVSGAGKYNYGTNITLSATPLSNYGFLKWTVGTTTVSKEANYNLTVTKSSSYTAYFARKVRLNVYPAGTGTVSGGGLIFKGELITLAAIPNKGYAFIGWRNWYGTMISTQPSCTISVSESNTTLYEAYTAEFTPINYTITTLSNPPTGGVTNGGGTFAFGTQITITAIQSTGYIFKNWTWNQKVISTNQSYKFTVDTTKNIVANFVQRFTVSIMTSPSNGGSISGAGSYDAGSTVALTATPFSGFMFNNWTENGQEVSKSPSYSFNISSNRELVANFTDITSVEKEEGIATQYLLEQNYPNPFNPSTRITFSIPEETQVQLHIYNSLGQEVASIINQVLGTGVYTVSFNALSLPTGTYFYRITTENFVQTKKMIFIK